VWLTSVLNQRCCVVVNEGIVVVPETEEAFLHLGLLLSIFDLDLNKRTARKLLPCFVGGADGFGFSLFDYLVFVLSNAVPIEERRYVPVGT
jgi:hypothetical protein